MKNKILIAMLLMLSLTACGGAEESKINTADVPTGVAEETPYEKTADTAAGIPSPQMTDADLFDNKIQIDGKIYTFPMTVNEFAAASGFELSEPDEMQEPYAKNVRAAFKPGGDRAFSLAFICENPTDGELSKKDCTIRCMYLSFDEHTNRVFLPGGFGTDMTKEAFAAKFGDGREYDGSLNTHYYQEPVKENEYDVYSGTGREISFYISNDRLKEYTASFTLDKPEQRVRNYSVNGRGVQTDIKAKCSFVLPEKYFVKPFADISSVSEVGGEYTNGEIAGDLSLVISDGLYIDEYEDEKAVEKAYKNEKIAHKASSDDKTIYFIAYDNSSYNFYGTAVVYDKNAKIAANVPVSFYTEDENYDKAEKDMLNYTAALLSTMTIEKTE